MNLLFNARSAPLFKVLFGAALIVVTWLSLSPDPLPDVNWGRFDKGAHLFTYLGLAVLIDVAWPEQPFGRTKWLTLLGYGVLIELIQSQIPNRMFSLADILANVAGIALYAFVIAKVLHLSPRRG